MEKEESFTQEMCVRVEEQKPKKAQGEVTTRSLSEKQQKTEAAWNHPQNRWNQRFLRNG